MLNQNTVKAALHKQAEPKNSNFALILQTTKPASCNSSVIPAEK
jgi:hypothetical protein